MQVLAILHRLIPVVRGLEKRNMGMLTLTKIPGHPAELSDSVQLLLTSAKIYVFEIDLVSKSTY